MNSRCNCPVGQRRFPRRYLRFKRSILRSVGQNGQELGRKYWATRSSVRLFARTAHFAHSLARGTVNDYISQNDLVLPHSASISKFNDGIEHSSAVQRLFQRASKHSGHHGRDQSRLRRSLQVSRRGDHQGT